MIKIYPQFSLGSRILPMPLLFFLLFIVNYHLILKHLISLGGLPPILTKADPA